MTHEDEGHYAAKHQGRKIDPVISEKIKSAAQNNELTCAAAHRLASGLDTTPSEIGIQTDLMELRITQCQLGLFGYSPEKKRIDPSIHVADDLWNAIETRADDGRISCKTCWDIASEFKISRLDLGSSCEKMGVRIKPCQLGAF